MEGIPSFHPMVEQAEQKQALSAGGDQKGPGAVPKLLEEGCPASSAQRPAPRLVRGTEPKPAPPPTSTPMGPAPPVRCLSSLRWLANAGVPTWPQSVLRSRCTRVHTAAAQELPRRLGAAGNRGLLCGPHRPAPAHLGAQYSEPSPGCHSPCTVWSRPPGVATSPGVQDWCIARNLILCVPGPPAPPCLFVTLRPCH